MSIEFFSFFSGLGFMGFMDLGFEEAGFDIAFVNEYNHSFIQAYQYARRNRIYSPRYGYYEVFASKSVNRFQYSRHMGLFVREADNSIRQSEDGSKSRCWRVLDNIFEVWYT
mgnify:CR=1 FL=1